MSEEKNPPERYLGIYYDRDVVLSVARWAKILSWVVAGIYASAWLVSFGQFLVQFTTGAYYIKGINFFDYLSYFMPFLTQPVPGVLYFFALQGIGSILQMLMDMEDNTRRVARNR
jgi:hypothetical protein